MIEERKLTRIGNSIGVTLPPELITALGLKVGDWLQLETSPDDHEIVITKSNLPARTQAHQSEIRKHTHALKKRVHGQTRAGVKK